MIFINKNKILVKRGGVMRRDWIEVNELIFYIVLICIFFWIEIIKNKELCRKNCGM